MRTIAVFVRDQSGATAMEYAFVIGIVSLAGLAAFGAMANSIDNIYLSITSNLDDAGS